MRSPSAVARARRPCDSIVFSTASAAAHASGLPPKVEPWLPGSKVSAAAPRARQAPIGTPFASPFATATTSGSQSWCWYANQRPLRPMPVWISSSIISQPWRSHNARTASR
jgi:hypothetical protein